MKNLIRLLFSFALLLIAVAGHSQDTSRAAKAKKYAIPVPSVYKPVNRPGYHHIGAAWKKLDSAAKAKALLKPASVTAIPTDTAKPAIQTPVAPVYVDHSLPGQYTEALKKMYPYEKTVLAAFYRNYMDTLNTERQKLKETSDKLAEATKTITTLQGSTTAAQQTLSESLSKTNQMSFLGIEVSKSIFGYIMWGLVVVLIGAVITVISLSGANRKEAAFRIQQHAELEEEFKAYKSKANEKEKKLARELQTERNKVDELLGKK